VSIAYQIGSRMPVNTVQIGKARIIHIEPKNDEHLLAFSRRAMDHIASGETPRFVMVSSEAAFLPALVKHHLPWVPVVAYINPGQELPSFGLDRVAEVLGLPKSYSAPFSPIEYFAAASSAKALLASADYLMPIHSPAETHEAIRLLKVSFPNLEHFISLLERTTHLFKNDSEHTGLLELLSDEQLAVMPGTHGMYRTKMVDYFERPDLRGGRVTIPADCFEINEGAVIAPAGQTIFLPNANSWHSRLTWEGIDKAGNLLGGMVVIKGKGPQPDYAKFVRALDWLKYQAATKRFVMREFNVWKPLYSDGSMVSLEGVIAKVTSLFPQAYPRNGAQSDYYNGALCANDYWDFIYIVPHIQGGVTGTVNFRSMEIY
jgi:hypothetical protein